MKIRDYGKGKALMAMPDPIGIQTDSFNAFLQKDVPAKKRENRGLEGVFREVFPVENSYKRYRLEYVSYSIGEPKCGYLEAARKGITYGAALRVRFRLITLERNSKMGSAVPTGRQEVTRLPKDIIEQEVYLGELPMMTERGTFVISGVERVVVSQFRMAPGISFKEKIHPGGKRIFSAEIVPERGPWIEMKISVGGLVQVNLDKKHTFLATTLLKTLGYVSNEDILGLFSGREKVNLKKGTGRIIARDVRAREDKKTVYVKAGTTLNEETISSLKGLDIKEVEVLKDEIPFIVETLNKDKIETEEEAIKRIYTLIRGTPPQDVGMAKMFFKNTYLSEKRYHLGKVGRYKLNKKFGSGDMKENQAATLKPEDFVNTIRGLIRLSSGKENIDDVDHLGNRYLRRVGDLLEDTMRIGLTRFAWSVRERITLREEGRITLQDIVDIRFITNAMMAFFGTSQLSQFMEQTNPLAELTHKRRLSKLGPGGLTRATAGLEARDVHYSHYGRVCPIETPEGPNIGIITSLACYAKVNKYGFIETPYLKVRDGVVQKEIEYLTADEEDKYTIAQANSPVNEKGKFINDRILSRKWAEFPVVGPKKVDRMDISPKQLVSLSTSLIPFLEHDDANRALMGSNMQRQAVPILCPEAPIISTGMEEEIAKASAYLCIARRTGVVTAVTSREIIIRCNEGILEFDKYELINFKRTNQDTCIHQRPIIKSGMRVKRGQIIADGSCTDEGVLALGKNLLVAFMSWKGYNFEDAIVVSERLLEQDSFSSLHIEEVESVVRDTKLGPEEVTRELPNVSEESIANLDEFGIVKIGTEVDSGDILVGKITPKGETEVTPEERLLMAIFGEKAMDVKDSSLRVSPGVKGKVINVHILSRKSDDALYRAEIGRRKEEIKLNAKRMRVELTKEARRLLKTQNSKLKTQIEERLKEEREKIKNREKEELKRASSGDVLAHGVLKIIKVFIAQYRNIAVGDKMAGRHGNKGTIAKIVSKEDMPYLKDGTPIDIVLNPLGVPSRMNVGQVLETHLGWAMHELGLRAVTPVFEGASVKEIKSALSEAGLPESGKTILYDGRTGERFDDEITIGYIYMMKLGHMVEDKIHARSIGSYALITQQPLGGKSQFGGQRFGEMEVWAVEAYGAAYTLQEMLTVKSDDVMGRKKLYESIIKGERLPKPGIPTSFNVLLRELNGLCLETELIKES